MPADQIARGLALRDAFKLRADIGLTAFVAWDSFSRADNMDGQGSLGTAESGHAWVDVTEPSGGWGSDRPKYFGIEDAFAKVQDGINSGAAIAVVDDAKFAVSVDESLRLTSVQRQGGPGGDPTVPAGHVVRYVDEDNWIACGFLNNGRDLYVRECKAGTITDLANGRLHSDVGEARAVRLTTTVDFGRSGILAISARAEGSGTGVGVTVRVLESDDASWFSSLTAATKVGIGGGLDESFAGWSAGKVSF